MKNIEEQKKSYRMLDECFTEIYAGQQTSNAFNAIISLWINLSLTYEIPVEQMKLMFEHALKEYSILLKQNSTRQPSSEEFQVEP